MRRRSHSQGVWQAAALGALLLATAGCGSRTELMGAPICHVEGMEQACTDGCGEGTMVCESGYWSLCRVENVEEPCENACGAGLRSCTEGQWTECEVPPLEEECTNTCGVGKQTCADGVQGDCQVPPQELECFSKCGSGTQTCVDNQLGTCSAPQPLPPTLKALVRDFRQDHPDFESENSGSDPGIVEETLGSDQKPVYANEFGSTPTTTGKANFDQWYRDVPGVNQSTELALPLSISPTDGRLYVYDNRSFFPIDGQLFGNESNPHNYHFTLEAQGDFVYQGGEIFRFTGDDDVWVFINNQLVIDLGGTHISMSQEVKIDTVADKLGLVLWNSYSLHMFFAERHTVESNFVIETSIAGLGECPG